ncbi:ComF family protein, partial [Salmonella enterica subsp. enterica]|nr:ComF family protein [Salmonella enterica subsp. enterica]
MMRAGEWIRQAARLPAALMFPPVCAGCRSQVSE